MIYLFDIDGTLTYPRQPITPEFEQFFYNWMLNKKVYFVTGSDRKKVSEQLSYRILDASAGLFCSMANELYDVSPFGDKLVYANNMKIPDMLVQWLEQQVEYTNYPIKTGNHIEYRTGMINFSVIGRYASKQERDAYQKWDNENGERLRIATYINRKFPTLEACVGGQISIDIQEKGKNKSQASQWIRNNVGGLMHFFGDRCENGGNDFDIVMDITNHKDGLWTNVHSPNHLQSILETLE